jgi:transposase-like protein
VKVARRWRYLYRAVDQYGHVINVLLCEQDEHQTDAVATIPPSALRGRSGRPHVCVLVS